jgi:hypothetical protein
MKAPQREPIMRRFLIALALVAGSAHPAALFTYGPDADGDSVVLTDEACALPLAGAGTLLKAVLRNSRGEFKGCWIRTHEGIGIKWEPAANDKGWRAHPDMFQKAVWL